MYSAQGCIQRGCSDVAAPHFWFGEHHRNPQELYTIPKAGKNPPPFPFLHNSMSPSCPFPLPFSVVPGIGKHKSHFCLLCRDQAQLGTQRVAVYLPGIQQGRGTYSPAAPLSLSPSKLSPAPTQAGWLWSFPTPPEWWRKQ